MDNNQQHRVRALKRVIRRMRRREYEHRRVWLSRMNQALAPCPFCGSDAEIFAKYISPIDPFNLRALWVAGCPTCEVFLGAYSIPEMVRLWNHRVYWLDPDSEPFEVTHYRGRGHSETLTLRMCPFCGDSPRLSETEKYRDPYRLDAVPYWHIGCPRCEVGQESHILGKAVQFWNRRPSPGDLPPWNAGRVSLPDDWRWNMIDIDL